MGDAETLRRAAAQIRERAKKATPGPWVEYVLGSEGYDVRAERPVTDGYDGRRLHRRVRVARCGYEEWEADKANAEHIAGMHPLVALNVADWLDRTALYEENGETDETGRLGALKHDALAVAYAILPGVRP